MRGALEDLPGVKESEIAPGQREIVVRYDPAKATVPQLLASLAAAGRPAKVK